MGANLSKTFVVDVESTCWATPEEQGAQPNELIEIGIVELNIKTGELMQGGSYLVKPRFTVISPFCEQLTGWKQSDVAQAPDIEEVLVSIKEKYKITQHTTWWSYGEYDKHKLSSLPGNGSLSDLYGVKKSPFSEMRAHFNAKTLFAMKHALKRELGLKNALAFLNQDFVGSQHNGYDDAVNITKLVKHILGPRRPRVVKT